MATAIDDNAEGKNLSKQLVKLSTGQYTRVDPKFSVYIVEILLSIPGILGIE